MGSESFKGNDAVSSPLLTDKTIATKRQKLIGALTSPPLPTLPFDLIPEILCRLPVKVLVKFRCVCKLWNSLISDSKFAEKHLRLSTTNLVHIHILTGFHLLSLKYVLKSYRLESFFTDLITNHIVQLEVPSKCFVYFVGSCNGILCFASDYAGVITIQLLNPSIRKFKESALVEKQQNFRHLLMMYGFGYDTVSNDYKVVVVLQVSDYSGNFFDHKQEVKVHNLGTNSWKSIQKFPFGYSARQRSGKFTRGTINWLVSAGKNQRFIVSLDLKNGSYKEILLPDDYGVVKAYIYLDLGVLRDCLCMVCGHDVWIMKEHGNKDSWTKLFTISYMRDFQSYATIKVLHVFENGQVLLRSKEGRTWKLISYNSRNGTFKFTESEFVNILEVCVESLISPCS